MAMAASREDSILAWLSRLPLRKMSLQAAVVAFESVGIEELTDLSVVDEEVRDEIGAELRNSGMACSELEEILNALGSGVDQQNDDVEGNVKLPVKSPMAGSCSPWSDVILPFKSPMAAYFDGVDCEVLQDFGMPDSQDNLLRSISATSALSALSAQSAPQRMDSNVSIPPEMFRSFSNTSTCTSDTLPQESPMANLAASTSPAFGQIAYVLATAMPARKTSSDSLFIEDARDGKQQQSFRQPCFPRLLASSQRQAKSSCFSGYKGSKEHQGQANVTLPSSVSGGIAPAPPSQGQVAGYVWSLSQDPEGSREVQHAIENAANDKERETLVRELQGRICQAMQCPHANHVLQKCVSLLEPSSMQFMIDELVKEGSKAISNMAHHRYGCRVLEKLLIRCASSQLAKLVASLLADASSLCTHRYGNFVMQRLLEHSDWRAATISTLIASLTEVGQSFFGSHVLCHAMRQEFQAGQTQLAQTIVSRPKLISDLRRLRHGPPVLELAFECNGKTMKVR